jgi:hypothetical protein
MTSLTPSKDHWGRWFLLVLTIALAQRAILWLSYSAAIYHDTGGYRRLADTILGGWQFYDGTRIPGYPLWMAWIGSDTQVYFSQLGLGVIWVAWRFIQIRGRSQGIREMNHQLA